jgi:hypothetical protein
VHIASHDHVLEGAEFLEKRRRLKGPNDAFARDLVRLEAGDVLAFIENLSPRISPFLTLKDRSPTAARPPKFLLKF